MGAGKDGWVSYTLWEARVLGRAHLPAYQERSPDSLEHSGGSAPTRRRGAWTLLTTRAAVRLGHNVI